MTVVVVLRHLGNSPFWRHTVAILASSAVNSSAAALIVLFGILFGPSALLVGSFYIMFFISFANIV